MFLETIDFINKCTLINITEFIEMVAFVHHYNGKTVGWEWFLLAGQVFLLN